MISRTKEALGRRHVQSQDNGRGRGHALRHRPVADSPSLSLGSGREASHLQPSSEFLFL